MTPEALQLVEETVSAHRERARDGSVKWHPAWHDLDEAGRRAAFDETTRARAMEQAVDPRGHSATVRAVLSRIVSARR